MIVKRTVFQAIAFPNGFILENFPVPSADIFLSFCSIHSLTLCKSNSSLIANTLGPVSAASAFELIGKLIRLYLQNEYSIEFSINMSSTNSLKCSIVNLPPGLGEPCFNKFQAVLCKELLKLHGVASFEIGSGFSGTLMKGSDHNDAFIKDDEKLRTSTNYAGGVLGGITNGMPVSFTLGLTKDYDSSEDTVLTILTAIVLDFLLLSLSN